MNCASSGGRRLLDLERSLTGSKTKMATLAPSTTRSAVPAWAAEPQVLVSTRPQPHTGHKELRRSTYTAFVCLGLASCITTNATYIELSYLMLHAPEQLLIFPYTMLALQSANVYPILYTLLNPQHRSVALVPTVWFCLIAGLLATIGLSCFWDRTELSFHREHSVVFLVLTHLSGVGSALFTTVFPSYIATFPSIYTSAVTHGTSMSGIFVALLGLWQAPFASEIEFSVSTVYLASALVLLGAIASFGFLEWFPTTSVERQRIVVSSRPNHEHHKIHTYDSTFLEANARTGRMPSTCSLRQRVFGWFWRELACQSLLAALFYGILPSISAFLLTRYSPHEPTRAAEHQLLATVFTFLLNPLACFLTSVSQLASVYFSTLFLVAVSILLVACTLLTDPPGSSDHALGFLLPLILLFTSTTAHAYTQLMLATTVKQQAESTRDAVFVESASQWSSFCVQLGAFAGTVVVFPIVVAWPQLFQQAS